MRLGPTSLQVSSVLAKGLRRPKVRSEVRISEQKVSGESSYVIKVFETNSYNRYGATEYELLTLCDGTRTASEIAKAMNERHPESPVDETEILDFIDSMEPAIWERSVGEKNLAVLERLRDERKSRVDQSNVLYITFKAWDPDKTLAKLDVYLGWIFTKGFVIFSLLLFVAAAYVLAGDWSRVERDTALLYSFQSKTAYDLWTFWLLIFALGGIHELGHGLTCKHYSGDVHQMGFMLIYFTPAFFTDTTDILLFPTGAARQWVIFAGIWVELVICGLSTLVWHFTVPGSVVNDLAYKMLLLSGIHGAVMNLNPLIKADGYYALGQFLAIDNLREDSFSHLSAFFRRYILRQPVELPPASRRIARIYLAYGCLAIVYSVTLLGIVLIFVKNVFVNRFGEWGYLFTLGIIYYFARKSLKKSLPAIREWLRKRQEEFMAWKMTRSQGVGAACVLLLLLIPPFPAKVSTDFVLEPGRDAHVRAGVPGIVSAVLVHQGDAVKAGQLLATIENPSVQSDARVAAQQLALSEGRVRSAENALDLSRAANAVREERRLREVTEVADKREAALEIRAPIDGVVSTPDVEQSVGQYLSEGMELVRIVDRSTMKARILVHDWEVQDVRQGASAQVKVIPYPYRTYDGSVKQILPAATDDRPVAQPEKLTRLGQDLTNYFAVVVELPNSDGALREGMTGTAKVSWKSRPLAWHAARGAWRWLQSQVW
jgi:putative peptide zinc metalloprotease protein